MANLTPDHLFARAEGLLSLFPGRKPRQTELRRAILASDYGLFHFLLAEAADMHIGKRYRGKQHYVLAYRSVTHTWLRSLCLDAVKANAPAFPKSFLPAGEFGQDMRGFAPAASNLQERRHEADDDPSGIFVRRDALYAISSARRAVRMFAASHLEERRLFLALLLFPPRKS